MLSDEKAHDTSRRRYPDALYAYRQIPSNRSRVLPSTLIANVQATARHPNAPLRESAVATRMANHLFQHGHQRISLERKKKRFATRKLPVIPSPSAAGHR